MFFGVVGSLDVFCLSFDVILIQAHYLEVVWRDNVKLPILEYIQTPRFLESQINYLQKELNELKNANDDNERLEEVIDIVQVCFSIINFYPENLRINAFNKHIKKLKFRKWKIKKYITFYYDKDNV